MRTKPPAKCPACGSTTLTIIERSLAFSDFTQTNGVIDPEGYHHHGNIIGISCLCMCGHRWTPRGARQVTDLAGYPKEKP